MPLSKRLLAEFIGTFWLVLGGCGSAPVRQTPPIVAPVATVTPLPTAPAVLPPPIAARLVMPASDTDQLPTQTTEQLYSFFARDFPIDQVLARRTQPKGTRAARAAAP